MRAETHAGMWQVALAALLAAATWGRPAQAQSPADLIDTRHNLSTSGPGPIRAQSESRICVFCHTPHNGTPASPLWNKALDPQVYSVYASPTLQSGPLGQPTGPTKLCLSCHDGTIAMGAVVNPGGGIAMAGSDHLPPGGLSDFGLDLSGHHPVAFPYRDALPNPELAPTPPADLVFGDVDELHCTTCHDPHNDQYGRFLSKDNKYSALCVTCHTLTAWPGSAHATSTASVSGVLPRPPKTWPAYTQLNEWGCEACHTPHFAPTPQQLLNFTATPPSPFSCTSAGCHSGTPGGGPHSVAPRPGEKRPADIAGQVRKASAHHEQPGVVGSRSRRGARASGRSVGCADCHNPHEVNDRQAQAPYASGLLQGTSGVDRNGAELASVRFEYEICFKCHGDNNPDLDFVPRVVTSTNLRLSFATSNPSYHPVVGVGRGVSVPSIPSSLAPNMTASATLYCSTCHADDEGGSRGPHGSNFAPILKERYETADGTVEAYESYALCYRCHERSSILADVSFLKRRTTRSSPSRGGHSGHLLAGAPCSACHDAHGVNAAAAVPGDATGSHTHLINFDTRLVQPKPGAQYPLFVDKGTFSGSCTLVCHDVVHDNTTYP